MNSHFVDPARAYQMYRVLFFERGLRGTVLKNEVVNLMKKAHERGAVREVAHWSYILEWLGL